jgi:hypothetical protein
LSIYRDYIKKLSPQAQFTGIISPQRIWNNIYYSLPQKWQAATIKHEGRTKALRFMAIENFVNNATFGTKLLIEKIPQTQREGLVNKYFLQDSLSTNSTFVAYPSIIKNPVSAADEILLEQANGQVLLVGSTAKEINKVVVGQPLTSKYLVPTDYFQNGRLHYLATTYNNLVFLTRDNEAGLVATSPNIPVSGGVKAVAASETKIFVADGSGEIYVIDEETQKISHIKSVTNFKDIIQLLPVKFKNNTYLAVLQKDGTLDVIYEQGHSLKGFPQVPLTARPVSMIMEEGKDKNSVLTLVSELGEIKRVDLLGNNQSSDNIQLERPDKATVFEVIFDQNCKDWFIVRRTPTSLVIFNKQGNSVIKIESTNFMKSQLRYFDLGNDLRLIAVFDGKNNTLFDIKGNNLGDKPLPASSLPAISYSEAYNKLFVYNPNKTRFEVWTVKLK